MARNYTNYYQQRRARELEDLGNYFLSFDATMGAI